MSPVSPCAPLYVSVMTQCLGEGVKRSGDLTQASPRHTISSPPARPRTAHLTLCTGALPRTSATLSPTPVTVCKCLTTQVKQLHRFSWTVLLVTFVLIFEPVVARPSVHVNLNKVTFRSQLCRPLSEAELQRLLGSAYPEKKMSADEAIEKRSFGYEPSSSGYQGDDPQVSSIYGENANEQDVRDGEYLSPFDTREREDLMNSEMMDKTEKVNDEDSRAGIPRRKVLNRGVSQEVRERGYRDTGYDVIRQDADSMTRLESLQTYSYMRRRRRRSLQDGRQETQDRKTRLPDDVRQVEEEKLEKKSAVANRLMRKLFEYGDDKAMKKKLKNKFRVKTKNTEKPLPWECKMRKDIEDMEENIYPRSLTTGQCLTNKCFYKLYNCEPIYYSVSVLKLNPIHCNPLPIIGNQTIFEERWEQEHRIITTGCNCVVPRKESSGRGQG